ncbi:Periplasmic binding protein OS=Tsukamurella paurometabola (strain ATCC 8368 / DSM / CCUG 35730/ CIP 100753 / JCM 10117 / KCTC 9821 / NBRC 16120 / NCIMB 702349 / NCTC 13040) OX=521096 GN=Tpau_3759 PE=3 SV=1 [Tsukamurella paurometabola]|uniref:Periplasmic binding protein n=1 Tax=Tsukamurella paurometabola (strain ATCC 8368 / DSM 20162 / CCUG 35730 / CIP 100753 / JCM 10117 / KCTC 9821 / NBRC 16120 / NCIMB 702349 / NCTC 13040) TaxID=521096 RepID=D5UYN4_TSUPD|nr:iron-siderophore ABC transporter substrate-binding protein [Tsukamurella paurometabola]ADG80337.1 periplasmic binding protein [Tsukamurella paurometabola DSM 20162]SUP39290.1 Putative ABC transporter substrate-binding lipoprotein yhfQ precursor [Tsukamurella paurometabola]
MISSPRALVRVVAIAFVTLLVAALTACGSSPESAPASSQPASVKRVASLGLGDVDTLLALGVVPVLVAPWAQDATEPVGEWSKPLLQGQTPAMVLGTGNAVDGKAIETIATAKPDLIVAVNSGFDDATFERLQSIAPVIRRPAQFAAWGVPWEAQVRAIAAGVGRTAEGDALIAKTNDRIAQAKADHPRYQGKTAATVLPKSDGGLYAYANTDGRGQVLTMLGFSLPESVSRLVPAGKFYADVSAENLKILDLDTLVYLDYGTKQSEETAFRSLKVVGENRVARIDRNLGNAMSMPNPVTLEWVLKTLPPKLPDFA